MKYLGVILFVNLCGCDDKPHPRTEYAAHDDLVIYRDELRRVTCYSGHSNRFSCVADPCPTMLDAGSQ